MTTTVNNLTASQISTDLLNLAPYASGSVEVLTSDVLALVTSGVLSIVPTVAARTMATLTNNTGGTPSTTLAAITAAATYAQADAVATKDAIASLAAQLAIAKSAIDDLRGGLTKIADITIR